MKKPKPKAKIVKKFLKPAKKTLTKKAIQAVKKIVKRVAKRIRVSAPSKTKIKAKTKKIVRRAKTPTPGKFRLQKPFLIDSLELKKNYEPENLSKNEEVAYQPKRFELPETYGDNKLVLLVRDPWWLYAYWETTQQKNDEVRGRIYELGLEPHKTVLRVYDVTDTDPSRPNSYFDIELNFMVNNWTIDVGVSDREWMVELGIRTKDGQFFMLVRSNIVRTPRYGVSHILDEEWLLPDELYWKIFGLSGGFSERKSSLEMRDILERYFKGILSSDLAPRRKLVA